MKNWLDLLKIIGGGGNTPPLIKQGLLALPKLFILRKTQDDLLREQNRLLGLLLAKQTAEPQQQTQQIVYVQGTPSVTAAELNTTPDFDIDEIPYIPRIIKGESSISSVDTSKSKFDPEEVAKLKQARAKALVDHPQD